MKVFIEYRTHFNPIRTLVPYRSKGHSSTGIITATRHRSFGFTDCQVIFILKRKGKNNITSLFKIRVPTCKYSNARTDPFYCDR